MDFSNLPLDCIFVIFSHFSYVELVRYSIVSHEWYNIATTNFLWKDLCTQAFCSSSKVNLPKDNHKRFFEHKLNQESKWLQGKYVTTKHGVHKHSVRGVSFSPKSPVLLASSGYDSSAHIFSIHTFPTPVKTFVYGDVSNVDVDAYVNWLRFARVRWMSDGQSIAVTSSTAGDLYLYNVETSVVPYQTYKKSTSVRLDRTAMAAHPRFPYLVAVAGNERERGGGGISLVDTRVGDAPVRFMLQLHKSTVRDIEWVKDDELLTASPDGTAKITNLEGATHTTVTAAFRANETSSSSYEGVLSATKLGNSLALGCAGCIEIWDVSQASAPIIKENVPIFNENLPIWRLKYNQRGSLLFAADDAGFVRVFHRKQTGDSFLHNFVGNILSHTADVSDLDISIDEEYVASASQSREVGIACLTAANWEQ